MLEAIQQKVSNMQPNDDFEWPLITEYGTPKPRVAKKKRQPMFLDVSEDESDDGDDAQKEEVVKTYWESVRERYQSKLLDAESLRSSQTASLPSTWTIVQVHLAEDKSTLVVSRQECGENATDPLLFCVPLKGRRDTGAGDEEDNLSFDDAIAEFNEIIRLSNEGTKAAVHVKADDEEARSNWWKQRNALDVRLKELLENIEFCWLGAFKVRSFTLPHVNLIDRSDRRSSVLARISRQRRSRSSARNSTRSSNAISSSEKRSRKRVLAKRKQQHPNLSAPARSPLMMPCFGASRRSLPNVVMRNWRTCSTLFSTCTSSTASLSLQQR